MATNGKPKTSTRTATKPKLTKAVREAQANLERVTAEARSGAAASMRGFARDRMRRELAAWIMAVRAQLEETSESVQEICFACREEGHLLYNLLDTVRLGDIHLDLQAIEGSIRLLTVACKLPNVLEVARGFEDAPFTADKEKPR